MGRCCALAVTLAQVLGVQYKGGILLCPEAVGVPSGVYTKDGMCFVL